MKMKKAVKKILPPPLFKTLLNIYNFFKVRRVRAYFIQMYRSDMNRYLKFSRTLSADNPDKMIGAIVLQYHVIEKGLTMPDKRLGFGKDRIISLSQDCINYLNRYGENDEQLIHAIGVVLEYEELHARKKFVLDKEVKAVIGQLKSLKKEGFEMACQIQKTKTEYFKYANSFFNEFSNSRSSVRNFTEEELPLTKIQQSLDLARNTPSACNRQSWRTYVYTEKAMILRILEEQGGNRGFGHLTNKLIVIAGELGLFCYTNERYQVYVDGGMYAMNLLYALHYNEIAACILNCSFDFSKELEIKRLGGIKESEVLIAMIACGIPPHEFKIAASPRYGIGKTNTLVN